MLGRIGNQVSMPCEAPRLAVSEDKWQRNEKDDLKTAIEYLYEFREKLSKLHPIAMEAIDQMLQKQNYRY